MAKDDKRLKGYRDEVRAVNAIVGWLERFETQSERARVLNDAKRVVDESAPPTQVTTATVE